MKSASTTNILWMAHVLPLYVIRFRLSPRESLELLASLDLGEWMTPGKKEGTLRALVKGISPCFFAPWATQTLGSVCMNVYDVPELQ